jgi:Protein of unknown function (DUF2845)
MHTRFIAMMALAATAAASADETIRCGSRIVTSAMSAAEILDNCGEPTSKDIREEDVRTLNANGASIIVGTTVIEEWTYDRGSRAAPIRIKVVDGQVRSIERIL